MIQKGFEWDGDGRPPRVEVEWDDTMSYPKWKSVRKAFELEPGKIVTMGYLLEWNERGLRISGSLTFDRDGLVETVGNTDVIPAGWVTKLTELTCEK